MADIGIIGLGQIASQVHIPVLRATEGARIAWVADTNMARTLEVAGAHKLAPRFIDGPNWRPPPCDIVLLAIPLPPRPRYFAALAAGETAIFAEKPLANTAAEHRELMQRFAPWRLGVGYQRRQHATSRHLRHAIALGLFGHPEAMRIREGGRTTRAGDMGPYQDESVANGGGIVKNLGCHSLDLALWLTGAATPEITSRRIEWDGDTDRRASARIMLGDVPLDWTVSWLDEQPNTLEIDFGRLTLSIPTQPSRTVSIRAPDGGAAGEIDCGATGGAFTAAQAFHLQWKAMIAGVEARRESEVSANTSLATAVLMDQLLER